VICLDDARTYDAADTVDSESIRPNFSLLVYPWNLTVGKEASLLPELTVPNDCGPVFLVHTHDDSASSLSSALFYVALKQKGVPAELHVFSNGGHGYGMRPVEDSSIATWPSLAEPWLKRVLAE
jgi:dipeptidyl aminopeptidase/acylaminoacyl peptidase